MLLGFEIRTLCLCSRFLRTCPRHDNLVWVSSFGFRIPYSGFGFRVSGLEFRIPYFVFRVSGAGFRVSSSVFRIPDFGFRVTDSGFWVPFRALLTETKVESGHVAKHKWNLS